MSIRIVNLSHLMCDACGIIRETGAISATLARVQAATEGWKYAEYKHTGYKVRGHKSIDHFDACPNCMLPADQDQARKIRDSLQDEADDARDEHPLRLTPADLRAVLDAYTSGGIDAVMEQRGYKTERSAWRVVSRARKELKCDGGEQ